jgi:hypothetical protein
MGERQKKEFKEWAQTDFFALIANLILKGQDNEGFQQKTTRYSIFG